MSASSWATAPASSPSTPSPGCSPASCPAPGPSPVCSAAIDYSTEETNYTLGLTQLGAALQRRSLVVVFTDFADSTTAELMLENLGRLIRRHLVLFVVLRDEELEAIVRREPVDADAVSRAVTAQTLLRGRDVVVNRLKRLGVHVVDAPADRIGPALISAYLDLKRRDLM